MVKIQEVGSDEEYIYENSKRRPHQKTGGNNSDSDNDTPQSRPRRRGRYRQGPRPSFDFSIFKRRHPRTIHVKNAEKSLKRVKRLATNMDNFSWNPLPIPIGLDSIIGLIPWIGDPLALLLSLFQVWIAFTGLGLPYDIVFRMLFNVVLDFFIGVIPFIGDLIDTFFQANIMNHKLAKKYFEENQHLYRND